MALENIYTAEELLARVATGDRHAFGQFYIKYYALVQKDISLYIRGEDMLNDLLQDIFLKIWNDRAKLVGVKKVEAYLFILIKHFIFNYLRALRTENLTSLDSTPEVAGGEGAEERVQYRQYYKIMGEGMALLPEGRRKVFQMSIEEGLTLDEIAARLGISVSGVKNQLYAAKAFIRQYLEENGELSVLLFVFLSLLDR